MNLVRTIKIRITNIYQNASNYIAISGVPISEKAYNQNGHKKIIYIKSKTDVVPISPEIGQQWLVSGLEDRRTNSHNGFNVDERHYINPISLACILPEDCDSFIQFINEEEGFVGIGEKKAKKLWDKLGVDIYRHIKARNKDVFYDVLTRKSTDSLFSAFEKYENLEFANWFSEHAIPLPIQQKIIKYHTKQSVELIKENPYLLTTFGMGFEQTDELALTRFEVLPDDSRRFVAAVEFALRKHENGGHTVARRQDIKPRLLKLLKSESFSELALDIEARKHFLKIGTDIQLTGTYVKEKVIAKRVHNLFNNIAAYSDVIGQPCKLEQTIRSTIDSISISLNDEQTKAVRLALTNNVSLITGGAGTGKTTVLKAIVKAYEHLGFHVQCVALSGRAAKRINETTNHNAWTIARLLHGQPLETLPTILIIDEASMIDVSTMFSLINHIDPGVRILMLGDENQLPPIGAGLVLNDLINSGLIPTARLSRVIRQSYDTGIPEYSQKIAMGVVPEELSFEKIKFHDVPDEQINAKCVELYQRQPNSSKVIAATYKAPHGGIEVLNICCQEALNHDSEKLVWQLFGMNTFLPINIGDPVIFTKNHYDRGIQNGSIGELVSVSDSPESWGIVQLEDSNQHVHLDTSLLECIQPAYAISLHKAQGSQFPRVIIPINNTSMLDRNWLYTAITRAELEVHIVGNKAKYIKGIKKSGALIKRKTKLQEFLN